MIKEELKTDGLILPEGHGDVFKFSDIEPLYLFRDHLKFTRALGANDKRFFSAEIEGGYMVQQVPEEFAAFLTYVGWTGIDVFSYLEIGSAAGGFIRAIHDVFRFERAVMIDDGGWTPEHQKENIKAFAHKVSRFVPMDSHSDQVKDILRGQKFDLIFVDGDHSYEGLKQDIDLVLPCAHKDTLIGFHDTYADPVPGVAQAINEALRDGKMRALADIKSPWTERPLGITVCKAI